MAWKVKLKNIQKFLDEFPGASTVRSNKTTVQPKPFFRRRMSLSQTTPSVWVKNCGPMATMASQSLFTSAL
ncbi:hypothetical protein O9993_15040 [Vibrio lentus]|nr:hypothetical protein [Vibrio lentus]